MKRFKRFKTAASRSKFASLAVFVLAFAAIGGLIVISSRAATGVCSMTGVVGTATQSVAVSEASQYRLWVRMQVPDTTNTGNNNGVRIELDGTGSNDQCFTVTTTSSSAANQWAWVKSDATAASTDHVTAALATGNYTTKIHGLRAGVKVDKVLLLRSDNMCTPDNQRSAGREPGDNCTTPAPTVSISADSTSLANGGSTTIRWSSTNATSCTGTGGSNNWAGNRATTSTFPTGNLTANQTYSIQCAGIGGTSSTQSVTVTVAAPLAPVVTLTANPTSVTTGTSSTLTWTVTNTATSCTAGGAWTGNRSVTGDSQSTGALTANRTYTLQCTGPGGNSNTASVTVTVTATPPPADTTPPSVTFSLPGVSVGANATEVIVRATRGVTWETLASDASGIRSIALTINGQTITGQQIPVGVTANGDFNLRAVVTDNANLQTEKTLRVRVRHADVNRSGVVDFSDVGALTKFWQTSDPRYDLNLNGTVEISDVGILTKSWLSRQ